MKITEAHKGRIFLLRLEDGEMVDEVFQKERGVFQPRTYNTRKMLRCRHFSGGGLCFYFYQGGE